MNLRKIWLDEIHQDSRYGVKGEILINHKSKYQEIIIINTENYGNVLMLDGCWMTSDKEEKYYHECLVHPALISKGNPSNILIIGGGDGGTARECLKYNNILNIDLVEIDEDVIEISKKYLSQIGQNSWEDKRLKINILDGLEWVKKCKDDHYDIIFVDCSDAKEHATGLFSLGFYKECKRILKSDGIFATQSESPESFKEIHLKILNLINHVFNISSTLYGCVPIYPSGLWSWTFASKDINKFLIEKYENIKSIEESCEIWNLNYQYGGFKMMPNKILKELSK